MLNKRKTRSSADAEIAWHASQRTQDYRHRSAKLHIFFIPYR